MMDSGNSGSFQCSSGGGGAADEEYDSCLAEPLTSAAAFLHPSAAGDLPPLHHHSPLMGYDTLSYLAGGDLFAFDASPPWPTSRAPTTTTTTFISGAGADPPSTSPSNHPLSRQPIAGPTAASGAGAPARASKKRSRASRRAPTTVLTTDTTNFRAMVQEFTGVPTTPFSSSAPASSSSFPFTRAHRLDIFGASAPAPAYLLRPFAQKVLQAPPPLITTTTTMTTAAENPTSFGDQFAGVGIDRHLRIGRASGSVIPFQSATTFSEKSLPAAPATSSVPAMASFAIGGGGMVMSAAAMSAKMAAESGVAPARGGERAAGMVESWICSSDSG